MELHIKHGLPQHRMIIFAEHRPLLYSKAKIRKISFDILSTYGGSNAL